MENSLQYHRLKLLAHLGFSPKTILDIGAYRGDWARMAKAVFPKSKIFMIEANSDHREILENLTFAQGFEIALLGDMEKKVVDFYLANPGAIPTGDSVFKEQTNFFRNAKVRKLPMTTLDLLVKKRNLKNIDFIKIDTQGSEQNILKGGKKTLFKAEFVLLETQNIEYNKGAPFIEDVIYDMKRYGFRLYDILELYYLPSGELMQLDLLFARKNSKFLREGFLY